MKKRFTSICLAITSLLMMTPALMAQEKQLSQNEKAAIAKEIVPAVFNQLKEVTGVDFLGFIKDPSIEKFVNSPFFTPQSALRADKIPLTLKPDSVKMDLSFLDIDMGGFNLASLLNDITIKFDNYQTYTGEINGMPVEFVLPEKIIANAVIMTMPLDDIMVITFTSEKNSTILPFSELSCDVKFSEFIKEIETIPFKLVDGNAFTFKETAGSNGIFNYDVVIGEAIRALTDGGENGALPNLLIKLNMSEAQAKGTIGASLFGLPGGTVQVPMGDAAVYLNADGTVFADSILITSYDKGAVKGYGKIASTFKKESNSKFIYTTTDSVRTNQNAAWNWSGIQTITAQMDLPVPSNFSVNSLIANGIMEAISQNGITPVNVIIESIEDSNGDGAMTSADDKTTTSIHYEASPAGVPPTSINMMLYIESSENDEAFTKDMDIKVIIPMQGENIKVEFSPYINSTATLAATAYMNSNAISHITSNDPVTIDPTDYTITENGIFLENYENTRYSIINMLGVTYANGRVKSSSEFIPTGGLSRGSIYILVIHDKDGNKAIKFVKR